MTMILIKVKIQIPQTAKYGPVCTRYPVHRGKLLGARRIQPGNKANQQKIELKICKEQLRQQDKGDKGGQEHK